MTAEEARQFHEKLLQDKEKLQQKIADMETDVEPISPENSIGRISRMDAINNKGVAEYGMRQAKERLGGINTWLTKFGTDAFGKCDVCQQEIQFKRLLFMPHSLKCMRCAGR